MLSNKQLKYLKSLHLRKFRQKYGNFLAEGVKTGAEIILDKNIQIEGVFALHEWLESNKEFVGSLEESVVHLVTEKELSAISMLKTPNQVLFVLKQVPHVLPQDDSEKLFALYLDEIRDPGNMGTILRIADWFGISWVFCSEQCVEIYNPKVVQSSMGAFLRIKTCVVALSQLKESFPNIPFVGTTLDGESLFKSKPSKPAILVIGNESNGISPSTQAMLDREISIPRHPDGKAESLNAAIATGIICAYMVNMENSL